ncbi:MAG: T9SS type A sorting domain-containing protein, partial [Bacteroidales bacterium]|nr:T9SS type A sorting domain-containing protein [Bacteroidales bacterium]
LEISTSFSLDLNWCIEGVVGTCDNTRVFSGYNVYLDETFVDFTANRFWQYTDLVNGQTYIAGVEAVYDEGVSEIVTTTFIYNTVGIDNVIVTSNELTGNYPNPFNTTTTITFSLAENTENTELSIYNIRGQKVMTLINKELSAGRHLVVWNGKDKNNKQVPCGTYFYKIKTEKFSETKKMILMK